MFSCTRSLYSRTLRTRVEKKKRERERQGETAAAAARGEERARAREKNATRRRAGPHLRLLALGDEAAPPLLVRDAAAVLGVLLVGARAPLELAVLAHDAAVEVDVAVDLDDGRHLKDVGPRERVLAVLRRDRGRDAGALRALV